MNDCCKQMLEQLLWALDKKFKPAEGDPNTPVSQKEFHQMEVLLFVLDWAEGRYGQLSKDAKR
jgi:hypothetical protein